MHEEQKGRERARACRFEILRDLVRGGRESLVTLDSFLE
jgi:hypothetical protein